MAPYQETLKRTYKEVHPEFTQNTWNPHHESKNGALTKNLIKNLKATINPIQYGGQKRPPY